MKTSCFVFILGITALLTISNGADEVISFATLEEQQIYLRNVMNIPYDEKNLMGEQEARRTLKTKEEISAWASAMGHRGRFIISGKIADEKGNLLENVSVNIQKSASGFWKSKRTSSDYTLSKYFVISVNQCDNLDLSFNKLGYISSIYYLSYSLKIDGLSWEKEEARNITQQGNWIIAKEQNVLLFKQGEFLQLKKFSGALKFDSKKEANEIFLLKSWTKTWEKPDIKEPYFKIRYMRDDRGKILTRTKFFDVANKRIIPERVSFELISDNPKDGILLIENPNIPGGKFLSTMGHAIDGNYVKEIPLPFKLEGYKINFYYFINSKYGKGSYETSFNQINLYQNNEKELEKKRNLWTR